MFEFMKHVSVILSYSKLKAMKIEQNEAKPKSVRIKERILDFRASFQLNSQLSWRNPSFYVSC